MADKTPVYVEQPHGFKTPGNDRVCRLNKALYGMCHSPLLWYQTLSKHLADGGFTPLQSDQCVFVHNTEPVLVMMYVDDFIVAAKDLSLVNSVLNDLGTAFTLKRLGPVHHFLGCRIVRDRAARTLCVSQDSYINSMVDTFKIDDMSTLKTPMAVNHAISAGDEADVLSPEFKGRYQALVGSLMRPATQTRPDISYAVGILCRYLNRPCTIHLDAAYRVARYLRGTADHALCSKALDHEITSPFDAHG